MYLFPIRAVLHSDNKVKTGNGSKQINAHAQSIQAMKLLTTAYYNL